MEIDETLMGGARKRRRGKGKTPTARGAARYKTEAKCPKCEKIHVINDVSKHKFIPRVFCENCR